LDEPLIINPNQPFLMITPHSSPFIIIRSLTQLSPIGSS